MRRSGLIGLGMVLAAGLAAPAAAQGIAVMPQMGVYLPASDFYELRDEADQVRLEKEGTLGLGLALELAWFRASVAYATGARLNERGVSGRQDIGDGSVLAAAADVVVRPLPRFLVQPYLLGGVAIKDASYEADDDQDDPFPRADTEVGAHVGIGFDLMLGRFGIVAEITDFITRDPADDWKVHDAFAMVGIKLRLGGY